MKAVQPLPNGYDPDFIAKNAALLEGAIVMLQFVALEVTPQIPEVQNLYKYAGEIGVPVTSSRLRLDPRVRALHRARRRGTELLAGGGRQRAQPR